ncbi:MAG: hypothetical protein JSS72_08505 [Armatimonadetes bacterium]|nr:hypothetical protein [Armatimonadota bacterium]
MNTLVIDRNVVWSWDEDARPERDLPYCPMDTTRTLDPESPTGPKVGGARSIRQFSLAVMELKTA